MAFLAKTQHNSTALATVIRQTKYSPHFFRRQLGQHPLESKQRTHGNSTYLHGYRVSHFHGTSAAKTDLALSPSTYLRLASLDNPLYFCVSIRQSIRYLALVAPISFIPDWQCKSACFASHLCTVAELNNLADVYPPGKGWCCDGSPRVCF